MPDPIQEPLAAPVNGPTGRLKRPLPNGPAQPAAPDMKAACDDMEALFIHHMLSEMRKTVAKSGLIDGGRSEEIYTSLMDAELAREMARSGGLGLSKTLQDQLRGRSGAPPGSTPRR